MKVIAWHPQHRKVNIGIAGDHQMTGLRLGTFAAYILTDQGPVIAIFNNYAHCPDQAQSIHSKIQLQSNGNLVNDTATVFGGLQMIRTNCGRKIPLRYVAGLPYLEQRPPTKSELTNNSIPHVIMTAEGTWNPRIVDDHETVEEMMKRFPSTDIEATDLFYTETGDIDYNHILNNYQADMESIKSMNSTQPRLSSKKSMKSMKSTKSMKSIKWSPLLSETNDGAPYIPEYKKLESIESNPKLESNRNFESKESNIEANRKTRKPPTSKIFVSKRDELDDHPLKTGIVIERSDFLYLEREDKDGSIFYEEVPLYQDVERSIQLIAKSVQHWSMTADSSILKKEPQQAEIKEPLLFAEDYNNEDDIKVFDHEYWTEHLDFDPSTVRMCYQGNADYLTDFDIHPEDAHHISTPIQPRSVQATPYDYEKVKSNFCWAPIEAIKRTFIQVHHSESSTSAIELPQKTIPITTSVYECEAKKRI